MVTDTSSLAVRISAQQAVLLEGQELSLFCNIDTQNLEERFFSVAWFRGNDMLAHIGPTGVLSVGSVYSGREKEGELRAARTGDRDYHLILQPVRTADHGAYICRAWPEERGQGGAFTRGAAQDSSSQEVSISATGQSGNEPILIETHTYTDFYSEFKFLRHMVYSGFYCIKCIYCK